MHLTPTNRISQFNQSVTGKWNRGKMIRLHRATIWFFLDAAYLFFGRRKWLWRREREKSELLAARITPTSLLLFLSFSDSVCVCVSLSLSLFPSVAASKTKRLSIWFSYLEHFNPASIHWPEFYWITIKSRLGKVALASVHHAGLVSIQIGRLFNPHSNPIVSWPQFASAVHVKSIY